MIYKIKKFFMWLIFFQIEISDINHYKKLFTTKTIIRTYYYNYS